LPPGCPSAAGKRKDENAKTRKRARRNKNESER
jgi:hypothetical protein